MDKNYLIFFILSFFCLAVGNAQSFDLKKMDALVVRLESGQNKTKVIQQKLEGANTAEMKKYWKQELEDLQVELKIKNQKIRTAFEQEFKFADVFYIYDYAAKDLKKGKTKDIFLNDGLQVDPNIQLSGEDFLVAAEGRSASAAEGIYLHHRNLERLKDRYVSYVKLNTVGFLFNSIFSSDDASQRMYNAAVQKLNRRLYKSQRVVE